MALVFFALPEARRAERLAGATSGPNRPIWRPVGDGKRERPSADAGEEVALGVVGKVGPPDVSDASFIYVAWRDQPR